MSHFWGIPAGSVVIMFLIDDAHDYLITLPLCVLSAINHNESHINNTQLICMQRGQRLKKIR